MSALTAPLDAGGLDLHGFETAEELTWLGFAFAHVALYHEAQRIARLSRLAREYQRGGRR